MKVLVGLLLVVLTTAQELVTQCQQKAREDAARNIKKCKSQAIASILGREQEGKEALKLFRSKLKELTNQKGDLKGLLCDKVENKFEPNGLIDLIPPKWGCEMDAMTKEVLAKVKDQHLDIYEDAYNIVLVGRTGAGKSYFGNALLGVLEPGRQTDVPFPAKATDDSVTQNIHAAKGTLFGGLYDDVLGLDQPMNVNVFDTPGFSDASIDNIRKNKLLIATALKNNIDMIIYVSPNPRFDANNQEALEKLNEWTSGKMWDNLIIAKARTVFSEDEIAARVDNNNNYKDMKNKNKIVKFLAKRQQASPTGKWNVTELVNGQIESHPLTGRDFKKLQISLINMAQHRECYQSDDHPISDNCWRMPVFDERGQYELDYDSYTFDEAVQYSDKFVFVEEAKIIVESLLVMSEDPIIPSAQIFQVELNEDIARFDALLAEEIKLDEQVAALAPNSSKIEEANAACEEKFIADGDCPMWAEWGEWTPCAGCGESASRGRLRQGCLANETEVDMEVCELDSMSSREERDDCVEAAAPCESDTDKYNNDNALLVEIMRQQAEAARLDQQYSQKMINDLMVKMSENAQASSMQQADMIKFFTAQNQDFQKMAQAQQTELTKQMMSMASSRRTTCLSKSDTAILCGTDSFEVVSLPELNRNHKVWSYDLKQKKFNCVRMVANNLVEGELAQFLTFNIDDDFSSQVQLTGDHLIYVMKQNQIVAKPANEVIVGDVFVTKFGRATVKSITSTFEYPVSPQTENGIILVNGIVTSTLTTKHGEIGKHLINIADTILAQGDIKDVDQADIIFTKLVKTVNPFLQSSHRGTEMFEAVVSLLKDNDIHLQNDSTIRSLFLQLNDSTTL